jgi:hypothetical protein
LEEFSEEAGGFAEGGSGCGVIVVSDEGGCGVGFGTDSVLEASVEGVPAGVWDSSGFGRVGDPTEGVSAGVFSAGLLSAGIFSAGVLSAGVLSEGIFSAGVLSVGVLSTGGFCVGVLSTGGILFSVAKTGSGFTQKISVAVVYKIIFLILNNLFFTKGILLVLLQGTVFRNKQFPIIFIYNIVYSISCPKKRLYIKIKKNLLTICDRFTTIIKYEYSRKGRPKRCLHRY